MGLWLAKTNSCHWLELPCLDDSSVSLLVELMVGWMATWMLCDEGYDIRITFFCYILVYGMLIK